MTAVLNLARKWRSQNFDQIVGQAITVRILKNTLYSNQYFPVYLFSGNKGCGKTSTARIFAKAINCQKLADFQINPRATALPCLTCTSCLAMGQLQHPDFIEIDAASHTGVDNVRMIIDAASLMPVLGSKKIYLIDEAHMLSKSAFNAFLKILEEPPVSVLFMLATTDPHKIIDTVRSRCFQLFFDPLTQKELIDHLTHICIKENIQADHDALRLIAQETAGCVRDALNLLEQLRFGHTHITLNAVIQNLGYIPENHLNTLFTYILQGSVNEIIHWIEEHTNHLRSSLTLWTQCKNYIRKLLIDPEYAKYQNLLIACLHIVYEYELTLQKSTQQQGLLELMLIEMGQTSTLSSPTSSIKKQPLSTSVQKKEVPIIKEAVLIPSAASVQHPQWKLFLDELQTLSDPLLLSIFKQALYKDYISNTHQVHIELSQNSPFFKDWINETEKIWSPLLIKHFGAETKLVITYLETATSRPTALASSPVSTKNTTSISNTQKNNPIDISDKTVWKTAHTLLETFGGTITESKDDEKIT